MSDPPLRRDAGSAERRVVTAMFCDVVGSTTLAETMDPEDWGDIVNRTVAVMASCVERYGGTVSQFAGDAILALFGAPSAHEDDPYRAIRAGLDIVDAVRAATPGIRVRVGINTGLVVVGDIDAGALSTYSALGDVPNVAARLQTLAEPDSVLISGETYRLVENDVDAREVGSTELKGRTEAVQVYEIVAVRGFDQRRRGIQGMSSPMVGRDAQLAALVRLCDAAEAGTGRVVAVLGEPGVGKSRLVEELASIVAERAGAVWAVGRCVAIDRESPLHLTAALVRSLAGVGPSDHSQDVTDAVMQLAATSGASASGEHLLQMLGLATHQPDRKPEQLRAEFTAAMTALFGGMGAGRRPIVIVCEDVHWADASSADVIGDMLSAIPGMPVVLVLTMRPDRDTAGWDMLARARRDLADAFTEITLDPLAAEHSSSLIANLLAIDSLPAHVRQLVLDKAEGNPFFLEEIVRMLIERDVVERQDDRWVARRGIGGIDVPATIQGLLAARIDLLDPDVREAGRIASVIGRHFTARLLAAVHPAPATEAGRTPTVHPHLTALEARGIVTLESTRPELTFAFRHALIHDVMYEGLLKRDRRRIHGQVATAIEAMFPDQRDEWSVALARHHEEAGDIAAAVDYLMIAGSVALDRGARVEAHRAYDRASHLLASHGGDRELAVRAALGRAQAGSTFTPGPEATAGLEQVLPIAEDLGNPDLLAAVYAALIGIRNMQGENYSQPAYRRLLDGAYALVPQLTDPGTRGLLEAMMGSVMHSADEYEQALGPYRRAVDQLEAAGRLAEASYYSSMQAYVHAMLGEFAEASEAIERAGDLARRSGDTNAVLDADIIMGSIAAERGDLEDALVHTRRGLELAESVGNTFCSLTGNFFVADQKLRLGEPEEAIAHLEKSNDLASYCNAGGYEALSQAWLAAARARMGRLDRAEFEGPLQKAVSAGSRAGEAMVLLNRAIALAGDGYHDEAAPDFERARVLFADIRARPSLARTLHAYGQTLQAAGRSEEGAALLREAAELFGQLGIQPDPAMT